MRDDSSTLSGTMDSPAQGVQGLPLAEISVADASLSFTVPSIGGSFKAQWDAGAKAWRGEWSQAGQRWPLSFAAPPGGAVTGAEFTQGGQRLPRKRLTA